MAHRTKGRLDGVGRAQMPPMGGGKGIEGKQRLFILAEAGTGFGVFGLVEGDKSIVVLQGVLVGSGQIHLVDQLLGLALLVFG